jgi:hypothetical protein
MLLGQRRRYYRLTGLGEAVCGAGVRRLSTLLERAGSGAWRPGARASGWDVMTSPPAKARARHRS